MKLHSGVFFAVVLLTGCAQNPLAKNEADTKAANAQSASSAPAPQAQPAASEVQATAPALPPCVDTPPARPAANNRKSTVRGKQAAAQKEAVAAAPCARPAPTPAPVAAAPAPAAQTQAAAPANASGAKREVKGDQRLDRVHPGHTGDEQQVCRSQDRHGPERNDGHCRRTDRPGRACTGKAFIPFYMGSGAVETWLHYKGVGRLLFASNGGF